MAMINKMTTPSNFSPNKNDKIDAIKRIIIILSVSCSITIFKIVFFFFCFNSFNPYCSWRFLTSSVVNPVFVFVFSSSIIVFKSF